MTMKLVRILVNNCVRFDCKENSDCWAAGNMVCVNRSSPKEWVRQVPEHGHWLGLKRREEQLLLQKQAHQKYEDWIWVEKVAMTSCGQVLKNLNYQRRLRPSHRCAGVLFELCRLIMPLSRWWKKWGDLHWSYILLVLRLILWWGNTKRGSSQCQDLSIAKIFTMLHGVSWVSGRR